MEVFIFQNVITSAHNAFFTTGWLKVSLNEKVALKK